MRGKEFEQKSSADKGLIVIAFIAIMNEIIKPYLAAKGNSAEEVDKMHGASPFSYSWHFGPAQTLTPGRHRTGGDPCADASMGDLTKTRKEKP